MTQEYMSVSNSLLMWIACTPTILWVLFQAWLFFHKSKQAGLNMGLEPLQIQRAVRSAGIASVGPCFVMLSSMLTLMLYVGAPMAWLGVDFIGSVAYKLTTAKFAANGLGIKLGSADMDVNYLATAVVVMMGGCVPWVLFAAVFSNKMEKVNALMSGGNAVLVPILGGGAVIGCFGSLTVDNVYPLGPGTWAAIASGCLMIALTQYNKKANAQWIREWSLSLCMVVGMIFATCLV